MSSAIDDETIQAFSRLLVANQRRIYGFILTLVHDRSAAEDILQDVSALLWQKYDKFEPGTDFAAWGDGSFSTDDPELEAKTEGRSAPAGRSTILVVG